MTYELTVHPFQMGTDKEAAVKLLEEAAESFGAWQELERSIAWSLEQCEPGPDIRMNVEDGVMDVVEADEDNLADELADTIQAACNLADRYDIDLQAAMERCERRNRERGRYE